MSDIDAALSGVGAVGGDPAAAAAAVASSGAAATSSSSSGLFKKKGAKRKEFRAPAASLAQRSDAQDNATSAPAPVEPVPSGETTGTEATAVSAPAAPAAPAPAVTVTDGKDNDDDDDSDAGAPAFSAAAAIAQAADVDTSDPESSSDEADDPSSGGVSRPVKRARKENPLVASTRNRLQKDHGFTIQSDRSVIPDSRTADHQITQIVEPTSVGRDPKKPKWAGPAKPAASNVRVISRMDYQPDVCKDYKQTGRCGYGDSCKFLHDRGDYKQGWQLEKDWNAAQEAKLKKALAGGAGDDAATNGQDDAGDLPWACFICRNGFTSPVVTKCGHYFCERCALDAYVKDTKCRACRAQTHGVFNTATKLITVMKRRSDAGYDPRREIEKAEQAKIAEKEKIAQSESWIMPGRTANL